jgi:HemY protein
MKLLIGVIISLFAAAGVGLVLRHDAGYVMLSIGQWTVETSVVVFLTILIVTFFLLYWLFRLLFGLLRAPRKVKAAGERRQVRKAQRLLAKGMSQLNEGRWKAAEKTLVKSADYSPTPALHYIGAAQAADKLGATWRRDGYLRKTDNLPDKDALGVNLERAEFLLGDGEPEKASAVLLPLYNQYPYQPRVLELLARSHRELGDWAGLKKILSDIGKQKSSDKSEFRALQIQGYRDLMLHADTLQELHGIWKQMPKTLREDESLIIDYAGQLRDHDAASEAEALLRDGLRRQWSDKLAVGYGELGRGNAIAQLATAETWLKQHENNPYLLLTLGRLAKRGRQMDKAKSYLEQSIKALPMPDAFGEMAEVLEEAGDKETANQYYRTGLRLLTGRAEDKEGVHVDDKLLPAKEMEATPASAAPDKKAPTVA